MTLFGLLFTPVFYVLVRRIGALINPKRGQLTRSQSDSARCTADREGISVTIALCFNCGAKKLGSYSRCNACGMVPTTDDELAWSLGFSDHYLPPDVSDFPPHAIWRTSAAASTRC